MPVSLILPCYKPQPGWEYTVCREFELFQSAIGLPVELIIVFDGHCGTVNDSTKNVVLQHVPGVIMIGYHENHGKGYATRAGVAAATGDIILYTDVDFPYATASMAGLYSKLASNECDIAAGVKNEAYYRHVPAMRRFISRGLRFFTGMLLRMPITDTQCGLKGFRQNAKEAFLATSTNRYLFDLEFIYTSYRAGKYRLMPVPVSLKENVKFRSMNYRILLPEMMNFIKLYFNKNK